MKSIILLVAVMSIASRSANQSNHDSVIVARDSVHAAIQQAYKDIDTAKAISNAIDYKLSKPKIVYRTKTKIIHVPVKVPIHDTVYITETKYVAVPEKDYYFKSVQHYNDSLKAFEDDSLRGIKKPNFFKRLFKKL